MKYVLMEQSHIEQIAEMEKICFSDPWSVNSITAEFHNPLSLWLVAVKDEKVVGYVGSQSVLGWSDMMNLAVLPEFRRMGIGETLVNELIVRLKEKKNVCLTLEVRESNQSAIALYEKMGFVEVGKRPNYYHNPRENALIMRKEWEL